MKFVIDTKTVKNYDADLIDICKQRLLERVSNYTYEELRIMKLNDYIMHNKYMVDGRVFIVFKTVVVKQQVRMLLELTEDSLILVEFYVKKKNKQKYYNDFKARANTYCRCTTGLSTRA